MIPVLAPLRVALVVVAAFVVQVTVFAVVRVDGVAPELPLLVAVLAGLHGGAERGMAAGFALGLLYDLQLSTPTGLWALVCALAAYPLGAASANLDRTAGVGLWLVTSLITGGGVLAFALFGAILGRTEYLEQGIGRVVVLAALWSLLLSPAVGRVLRWAYAETVPVRPLT